MPILEVEIVGAVPDDVRRGLARRIADAAGDALEARPGGTWVRLRFLDRERYAESGGDVPDDVQPVFVSVLLGDPPGGEARAEQARRLTRAVAAACDRPARSTHVLYEPAAKGRIAFGERMA
jgi:phenylpyruvate tautomerase PptA (4-oxalocrotonate tautomerase family)